MRFPNLRTFEPAEYPFHTIDDGRPYNAFIKAHGSTLQEVKAAYFSHYQKPCSVTYEFGQLDGESTQISSKVRIFKGPVESFTFLGEQSPILLADGSLRQLDISVNGRDGPAVHLLGPWLRKAITSWQHFFLYLEDLTIAVHRTMNYSRVQVKAEEMVYLIKDIARLCGPSLMSFAEPFVD